MHVTFHMQNTFTFLNHGAFGTVLKEALHASLVSTHTQQKCVYYQLQHMYVKILHSQLVYGQRTTLHFLHNFFLSLQCLSIHTFSHKIHATNFPSLQKRKKWAVCLFTRCQSLCLPQLLLIDGLIFMYIIMKTYSPGRFTVSASLSSSWTENYFHIWCMSQEGWPSLWVSGNNETVTCCCFIPWLAMQSSNLTRQTLQSCMQLHYALWHVYVWIHEEPCIVYPGIK